MTGEIEYLEFADLMELAGLLFGDPAPIRDSGLLGAAAARPATTAFGNDAYTDVWTKAGALLQSIVKDHPLIDGNKRLGWLATGVFLELNGVESSSIPSSVVYALVMDVAAGTLDVEAIAERLRRAVEG